MGRADKLFTDGEAYERFMGRWSRLVGESFLEWLDAPKGLRWLAVGCGNGAFTEELIARCAPAAVTAIDPSEDQLAYPFGIGDRDLILKLRLRNTDPRSFGGDRRDVISR